MIFISIAFAQWGMSFLALFEDEYRLYKMRDPLTNIQYVIRVAKENDALKWVFPLFSNDQIAKSTDFIPGQVGSLANDCVRATEIQLDSNVHADD